MNTSLNDISDVVEKSLCTGCGTCFALCPTSAIEMYVEQRQGIYLPRIDSQRCNRCGLCYKICPGHTIDLEHLNMAIFGVSPPDFRVGNLQDAFVAHAMDQQIRFNGSSGGMITALLVHAFEKNLLDGALVVGMRPDMPWEPQPFIARTADDVISAAGSKYTPVSANVALVEILKRDGRYAFVGLPCHIHGLRKAQMTNIALRKRIVLVLGLFCASARTFVGLDILLSRFGMTRNDIETIRYRGCGWPGSLEIRSKRGEIIRARLEEYYHFMSCNDPYRCGLCPDKTSELSDISFGDAWLPTVSREGEPGKSIVISRNESAEKWLTRAVDDGAVTLAPLTYQMLIRGVGWLDKKRKIGPRLILCKMIGKSVPNIHCNLSRWMIIDFFSAFRYYAVRFLTKYALTRKAYFITRKKYRTIEFGVSIQEIKGKM